MKSVLVRTAAFVAAILATAPQSALSQLATAPELGIDHQYHNTDAQSLIGLPFGSHKTTVEKDGSLKWSQWSLKRRELDSPIGFSAQMDGALAIQPFATSSSGQSTPLKVAAQTLYRGHYPFVVSTFSGDPNIKLEELAFAVDPEAVPGNFPGKDSGAKGFDTVCLTLTNQGTAHQKIVIKLSGRNRNLPGHVVGDTLITGSGEDVAIVSDTGGAAISREDNGLTLALTATVAPKATQAIWIRLPYEWPSARNAELSNLGGEALLNKAVAQWDDIWSRGAKLHYPQQVLNDFYQASIAYVMILSEYDAAGDLWLLDGAHVYRQYWGRGEYFQARALEVAGYLDPARQSVEHPWHIINDDGEWDGPPVSGWPAWDNIGGNAGAAWDYYLYTRNKAWLAKAYPYLLRSAEWVRDHREETHYEEVKDIPAGARPIRRMITGSKCRPEPVPELAPGEKTYWYGLLPWSYGDSGIPEGHAYSHNFLSAFAVRVTAEAAKELGKTQDAAWLEKEYADYSTAIRDSIERSVKLEKTSVPYLPAQPTRPDAAYSQTFLAVWPIGLYRSDDPLVTGLLKRMESEESQGLPTNVAWAGPAGIWPGESMNMSETYLLRGEIAKNAAMLIAAINHSYTTDVFKEEILTDVTKGRACEGPHSNRQNGQGTGDMPEAWGNANAVDLLRDMLIQERTEAPAVVGSKTTLHLLSGLPAEWLSRVGEVASMDRTPTTLGTAVSVSVTRTGTNTLRVHFDPGSRPVQTVVHVPLLGEQKIASATMNGKPLPTNAITTAATGEQADVVIGETAQPITLDFTLSAAR